MSNTEVWRDVLGYEGRYEVSSFGSVRMVGGPVLGQWKNSCGYLLVKLSKPRREHRVHRLVAEAFLPNPSNLTVVNHIDFNPENNCVENLEWCTQCHNIQHSRNAGRYPSFWKGRRSPSAILSDEEVVAIREKYAKGEGSWASLALEFGVAKRTIGRVVRAEHYRDVCANQPTAWKEIE